MQAELTYDEVAQILECSPRHVRTILGQHQDRCPVIRYSHKNRRVALADVMNLKKHLRTAAIKKGNTQ